MVHQDVQMWLGLERSFELFLLNKEDLRVHSLLSFDRNLDPEHVSPILKKAIDKWNRCEKALSDVMTWLGDKIKTGII